MYNILRNIGYISTITNNTYTNTTYVEVHGVPFYSDENKC